MQAGRRALPRVHGTSRKRLRWLLGFSALRLASLDVQHRQQTCEDLVAFIGFGATGDGEVPEDLNQWVAATLFLQLTEATAWRVVEDFQQTVKDALADLLDRGGVINFPPVNVQFVVQRHGARLMPSVRMQTIHDDFDPPQRLPGVRAPSRVGSLWFALALVLQAHGRALRRCVVCATPFVFDRQDQTFCSDRCRAKRAMRRMRWKARATRDPMRYAPLIEHTKPDPTTREPWEQAIVKAAQRLMRNLKTQKTTKKKEAKHGAKSRERSGHK